MVKGNWALFEEDFWAINTILQSLIQSASARSVMLIDKTGQLVSSIGEPPGFDVTCTHFGNAVGLGPSGIPKSTMARMLTVHSPLKRKYGDE